MKRLAHASRVALQATALLILPCSAMAHGTLVGSSALIAGFLHPMSGLDHLLAAFGAGALAQWLGGRTRIALPLVYLGGLLVAMLTDSQSIEVPTLELLLAATVGALGLLLLVGTSFKLQGVLVAAVVTFAMLHGHAHRIEYLADTGSPALLLGFIAGTATLLVAGSAVASLSSSRRLFRRPMAVAFGSVSAMLLIASFAGAA